MKALMFCVELMLLSQVLYPGFEDLGSEGSSEVLAVSV